MSPALRNGDTAASALDVAERLVQTRGFNGFSYADIARELGVTKPALHYHFAGKAELGEALIDRYAARFTNALEAIDAASGSAPAKLTAYVDLYRQVLAGGRMCLCGMLAAEHETLPASMLDAVVRFFIGNESWLASLLEQGRDGATLAFDGPAADIAASVVGCLEGALLLARLRRDIRIFDAAATRLLGTLRAGAS